MSDKKLEELAAEERREYFRRWRAANPEKVKRNNANYWRKRAEKRLREQREREGT